jgi:hypothetical protein
VIGAGAPHLRLFGSNVFALCARSKTISWRGGDGRNKFARRCETGTTTLTVRIGASLQGNSRLAGAEIISTAACFI